MTKHNPYILSQELQTSKKEVQGFLTEINGESMYCIQNYDSMDPFFMSIVSSSDLWMFLSSKGSLTAGRQNYNNAIFPYYTDDKIHDSSEITGPKTIIRLVEGNKMSIWEPFSTVYYGLYKISRNLFKNTAGSKIIFEEINHDLKLKFTYSWTSSDDLGWIRRCELVNESDKKVDVDVLDGVLNVIPYGITRETQSMMSTLMDAYKVAEWLPAAKLALFRFSSIPVDRAEPSEALRTNTIWVSGFSAKSVLLSSKQINSYRFGGNISMEQEVFGVKTSLLINDNVSLNPKSSKVWYFVADVAKDSSDVVTLVNTIKGQKNLTHLIEKSIAESAEKLNRLVALADGVQHTGDKLNDSRHFANVMFNVMRGGIFENVYEIDLGDFIKHIEQSNKVVYEKFSDKLEKVHSPTRIEKLIEVAKDLGDRDLLRLTYEYLPLSFSRRHGDPSRPWNFFDINIKNPDGSPSLNYQGNWRDIFQNWEALAFSFPEFLPGMICRFLNASTADGYNPYRLTREGFDWEVPEPDNPWAYIGYWGDHQIIYLLKLLELYEKFYPGKLAENFSESIFVYANVPYRIKKYKDIVKNPQDTILFDWEQHNKLMQRSGELGADGKLFTLSNSEITRVSFIEKILVSLLTKLSNFVPDAGIWLNTQRPEWNDANNALVGNGASMVTLYHLRRYINFFVKVLSLNPSKQYTISNEVAELLKDIFAVFNDNAIHLEKGFTDLSRRLFTDSLGNAGCSYRSSVYSGFDGKTSDVKVEIILDFLVLSLSFINQSIASNKREDGLFHSYNLLEFSPENVRVQNLQLMLEGQAAVLTSEYLNAEETVELMGALFKSELWREDQQSFLLYPFKKLPNFLDKNLIPHDLFNTSKLLKELVATSNTHIVKKDEDGNYHFNANLRNAQVLKEEMIKLPSIFKGLVNEELELVSNIYERVFQHRYFTGRSGSFYKYEGLGSIYWHLVSKLLQTLGDRIVDFALSGKPHYELKELINYYNRVKAGIGVYKNPKVYGAFPTDPYSHTPSMLGAQQPGMTGQVKEDILSRFNELGLVVRYGEILTVPVFITKNDYYHTDNIHKLEFTFCGTPFTYQIGGKGAIQVIWSDKSRKPLELKTRLIPEDIAHKIFSRTNEIARVLVHM